MSSGQLVLPANINPCVLFEVWRSLAGNVHHTSLATGVSPSIIKALEHDFQWNDIAGGKLGLADKKQEKEIARALAYAQGGRLQKLLDRAMSILEDDDCAKIKECLVTVGENGSQINTKPLVELAKAMETVHNIKYRALGDKVAVEADTVTDDIERTKALGLTVFNLVNNAASAQAMKPADVVRAHKDDINV